MAVGLHCRLNVSLAVLHPALPNLGLQPGRKPADKTQNEADFMVRNGVRYGGWLLFCLALGFVATAGVARTLSAAPPRVLPRVAFPRIAAWRN